MIFELSIFEYIQHYKLWTREDTKKAMAMVADGSSIKDSSVVYDIPEATLQRHMKKGRYMVNIRCICMQHVTIITSANEVCLQICSKIYVKVAHHHSTIHLNDPDSGSGI